MTFVEALANFTTPTARHGQAKGFLPPLFRANGHLLFALGLVIKDNLPEDEGDVLHELTQAETHLASIEPLGIERMSEQGRAAYDNLAEIITLARNEFEDWDRTTRVANLRNAINRVASITVLLDRELLGLTDSDAGTEF